MTTKKQPKKIQQAIRSTQGEKHPLKGLETDFQMMKRAADLLGFSFNLWAIRTLKRRAERVLEREELRQAKKGSSKAKRVSGTVNDVREKASA